MRKLIAYFTLIRVHNCLIAAFAVSVGYFLSPYYGRDALNPFAMAAAFFVCAFGNVVNDLHDVEADKINHPRRALPSGSITPKRAATISFLFLCLSLATLIWLSNTGRIIVIFGILLVTIYNLWLKHTSYWGNLAVSLLGAMTFILGGISSADNVDIEIRNSIELPGPLIPAVFAFLMHFGREIIKDLQDVAGDVASGSRTAPVKKGMAGPMILANCVFLLLIILSLAVYYIGWFDRYFLFISIVFIYIPLVYMMIWMALKPVTGRFETVSTISKLQMIPGIFALVIGKAF